MSFILCSILLLILVLFSYSIIINFKEKGLKDVQSMIYNVDFTSENIEKQKAEDERFYKKYERLRLESDKANLFVLYRDVKMYLAFKDSFNERKKTALSLQTIELEYNEYLNKCNKLNEKVYILTIEEYLHSKDIPAPDKKLMDIGIYNIYHYKTAKYNVVNELELLEKEFKQKWY